MERDGPLKDLTIIDCTMAYAGPWGSTLLADLGANVIKVEPPGGDGFRLVAPYPDDYAPMGTDDSAPDYGVSFASVNRNKRSICLDLKDPADKEILLQLCEQADAVLENMRAGVMDKLGLSFETIRERNPKIVYGAVRGYGDPRTGESPYQDWPCLDVAGQSAGGLVETTGDLFGIAIADIYPGTLMALGLLAAVHKAQKTGKGEFFDVAMYDSIVTLVKTNITRYSVTKKERVANFRSLVPFGLFPASNGRVAIAAPVERHWVELCKAMDREDLITDDRTRSNRRRVANYEFTEETVGAWSSTLTKQEVVEKLGGKVPCGPANNMDEVFNDPHVAARNVIERFQFPGEQSEGALVNSPIRFQDTATTFYQRPPRHGEHTDEILQEFGIERNQ